MNGTDVIKELGTLSGPARERKIIELAQAGNVPAFLEKTIAIHLLEWKGETIVNDLEVQVSPEPFGLGTNADWRRMPVTLPTIEVLAGDDWTLPTPRIVQAIHDAAAIQLVPIPRGEPRNTIATFDAQNAAIEAALAKAGYVQGQLVDGEGKDYVAARRGVTADGKPAIAIFGWFDPSGAYTEGRKNAPIQGLNTTDHDLGYVDYSQLWRLVRRMARLNGSSVDLQKLYHDPKYAGLVGSDLGTSSPIFPFAASPATRAARAFAGLAGAGALSIGLPALIDFLRRRAA